VATHPEFGCLKTVDIVLDSDLNPKLSGDGVNRALTQLSELKSLEIFNVKIFVENTEITALDTGLKKMATSCRQLKRLDFIMDYIELNGKLFDVFSGFQSLEFCEISIEYNEDMDDYGLIEQFRKCPRLRVFNMYLYNICDKHLVNIDRYIPNITNFHLRSKTGITDSTLHYLKNCRKLEVFEVHTYDDRRTRIAITDSGVCLLVKSCPRLRYILLFSRPKNMYFCKTITELIEKAINRPKVKHCLGSSAIIEMCDRLAASHKKHSKETKIIIPSNLRLVELPDWTHITSYEHYCNEDIPESYKVFNG